MGKDGMLRIYVHPKSKQKFKIKLKGMTSRSRLAFPTFAVDLNELPLDG